MPYAEELRDPAPNIRGVSRGFMGIYGSAGIAWAISPSMHENFFSVSDTDSFNFWFGRVWMLRILPIKSACFVLFPICVELR